MKKSFVSALCAALSLTMLTLSLSGCSTGNKKSEVSSEAADSISEVVSGDDSASSEETDSADAASDESDTSPETTDTTAEQTVTTDPMLPVALYRAENDEDPTLLFLYEYDENGNLIDRVHMGKNNSLIEHWTTSYDEAGNVLEEVYYEGESVEKEKNIYSYVYDDSGLMLEKINETSGKRIEYVWSGDLLLEESNYRDGEESDYWKVVYNYDDAGNLMEKDEYNEGDLESRYTYTYDEQGVMTQETWFYKDHEAYVSKIMAYDEQGNVISEVNEAGNGNFYYYDSENNLVLEAYFKTDEPSSSGRLYDKNGNLLYEILTPPSGKTVRDLEYTFDSLGRLISIKKESSSGNIISFILEYQ